MAIIKGHSYSEILIGTDGPADYIYGYGGDDWIYAGGGNDNIEGGAGNDVIFGGDGNDTISYLDYIPPPYSLLPGVTVDLASGTGKSLAAGPTIGTFVTETDTFFSIENVTGSNYDDHLSGDGGPNWLVGWGGNDQLEGRGGIDHLLGLDGDDHLDGGSGADALDGGQGIDTTDYGSSSASVNVSLATGKGYSGDAAGDTLYDIENLTGSDHADDLYGDGNANILFGGDGDDFLKGGGGGDKLYGGEGIDTADYSDSSIGVYVSLKSGAAFNGTATGDELSSIENLTGSYHGDVLEGDGYVNTLTGLDGDDVLQGYGSADTIDGGDGSDTAIYGGSSSGVTVLLTSGQGHGSGGDAEGDILISIENLRGSDHGDTLWGNDEANVLEGLGGNDKLEGGGGADTLLGGLGADTMTGGLGADHFVWDAIAETGLTSATIDTVVDFDVAQLDKIDLHAIDANVTVYGQQDFTFIGPENFSAPGQVRYFSDGVDTFIGLNTDNIFVDDAVIRISGLHTPDASWFVL